MTGCPPAGRTVEDVALVIEGGGMRAAYTSGLVRLLVEEQIDLPWVGAISAGSSLLCNYLSRDAWRTEHSFTDFVLEREFGGWGHFVRGRGYFNAEFIYERAGLPDAALPFDWDAFAAHPATPWIGAFDATTGEAVSWGREDMRTAHDLFVRVRASSTIPVIMPAVVIDGHVYVDGALGPSGGIPLHAAQEAGYRRFLVLLTQQRDYHKPPEGRARLLRTYFRNYPAVPQAVAARSERYNATREEIFDLERQGQAYVFAPRRVRVDSGERSVTRLRAAYAAGLEQAQEELPAIRAFLGV